ncbi:DNA-3-methyladenine glycosylase I [Candidatus Bathyarchaeota archaeon]|nr:DNA-3-methyladenine glycosylase I [Candidatus Bathyarchaeota archaeon]
MENCWNTKDPLMASYHDEWGTPVHDDNLLFEFLSLEGMQAGLSWGQILKRRKNYQKAFLDFDPKKISNFTEQDINLLLTNKGIIRNRRKIESIINNSKKVLEIQKEYGSFDAYVWKYVNNKPIDNELESFQEMKPETELSKTISKELKKRGFKFVGPKIIYSFMQAVGLVNDHLITCPKYNELKKVKAYK